MRHWSSALVLGIAGASFACARTQSAPVSLTAAEVTSGEAHPTFAPAGEQFTIQMNTLLNSATTEAGKLFSAEVVSPVLAQDGTVLVPVGATLVGYVDEIDSGNVARIGLAFDKVETTRGPAPLAVKVLSAQNYLVGGKSDLIASSGGGSVVLQTARQIIIPLRARLDVVLTRPIVPVAP